MSCCLNTGVSAGLENPADSKENCTKSRTSLTKTTTTTVTNVVQRKN